MLEDCTRIFREYGLEVVELDDMERLHTPPVGYVAFSECYLQFRVRFPLNPLFIEVLEYFGLTTFQITPNGWAYMIGLFNLFTEHGMGPPTAEEFAWFYLIKSNKNNERLQAIVKIKDNLGPWKEWSHTFSLQRSKSEAPSTGCVSNPLKAPIELVWFWLFRPTNT